MGIVSRLFEALSIGCRSRTHSFEKYGNCYEENRRSIIPTAPVVIDNKNIIVAVNEEGEEVIILVEDKPK